VDVGQSTHVSPQDRSCMPRLLITNDIYVFTLSPTRALSIIPLPHPVFAPGLANPLTKVHMRGKPAWLPRIQLSKKKRNKRSAPLITSHARTAQSETRSRPITLHAGYVAKHACYLLRNNMHLHPAQRIAGCIYRAHVIQAAVRFRCATGLSWRI
jgi:hypothetical protein